MSQGTKIEWTQATWNPVTGCTKISPACEHCYAERMAKRLAGRCGYPADEPFKVTLHPDKLEEPLHWRKPRMVFVGSMGDLFHEDVPFEYIEHVFEVMRQAEQHTFQVLTKRPRRAKMFLGSGLRSDTFKHWPFPNVWVGVTAEDQERADERIPVLLQIPAAVRFVSVEPMLGSVDLEPYLGESYWWCESCGIEVHSARVTFEGCHDGCGNPVEERGGLEWVIVGGETGPGARPMHPEWVRSLRDQCQAARVPFFFKSWGEWFPRDQWEDNPELVLPDDDVAYNNSPNTHVFRNGSDWYPVHRVGKKAAGALLDGREWRQMPEHREEEWGKC